MQELFEKWNDFIGKLSYLTAKDKISDKNDWCSMLQTVQSYSEVCVIYC